MSSRGTRVGQVEERVAQALRALVSMHHGGMLPPVLQPLLAIAPPSGMQPIVQLRHEECAGDEWEPNNGEVRIHYEERGAPNVDSCKGIDPLPDLIDVLSAAEDSPQLHFVALKFLRDRLLPQSEHDWAQSPPSCQRAIAEAIEKGVLVTSKKPNPRNPAFPVTAVELNRMHPAVRLALGGASAAEQTPAVATPPTGPRPLSAAVRD